MISICSKQPVKRGLKCPGSKVGWRKGEREKQWVELSSTILKNLADSIDKNMKGKLFLLVSVLAVLLVSANLNLFKQDIDFGGNAAGSSVKMMAEYGLSVAGADPISNLSSLPVETIISRRQSIHYGDYYSNASVPSENVSRVLWAAYGISGNGRTVPSLYNYPMIIYCCNETAAYRFVPASQSLVLWKEGDYRQLGDGYTAPIQLFIVLNTNICSDVLWGNAESGNAIQNIYLMANTFNLGTVCEGGPGINRTQIAQGLGLPDNEQVLYKMPLGYPLPPYVDYDNLVPTARPSSPQLPQIQDSNTSLEIALNLVFSSYEWNDDSLTQQELSQVLWATYGYSYFKDTISGVQHRTVPSAGDLYPMTIYAANSTGVYEYVPGLHDLTTVVTGDKRSIIASASGNNWASSAPLIIATVWNDTKILTEETTYVEVGLITQNVYLEGAAWGLITDWGRADGNETAMKEALGITDETNLHPASIITVGHPACLGDLNGDFKVSLSDLVLLANAYGSKSGDTKWNPNADINGDGKVSLSDLVILANHYGRHYPHL